MDCSNAAKAPTKSFAICQASPSGNVAENVQKIIEWMKNAAKSGAEIALFGELFLSDYNLSDVESLSVPSDGVAAITIANAAKEIGIAVVFGYSEVADGRYYNSLMFIDKHGERIANYRKVHVWPTEASWYTPGDTTTVVDWEGYRVGLGICADVCMHEYVSAMVLRGGAQMVIIINALVDGTCYVKTPLLLAPARAYENRCYIVYVDLAGERYEGMSRLYNPLGDCVVSACTHEEVLLTCTIPLYVKVPYTYHTLRRPEVYSAVVSYETELPWRKRSREDVKQYFTKRACYYDKQMEYVYNGPSIAAHALAEIITGSNKSKKILDVAAGTGLVGKALSSEGFTNISQENSLLYILCVHVCWWLSYIRVSQPSCYCSRNGADCRKGRICSVTMECHRVRKSSVHRNTTAFRTSPTGSNQWWSLPVHPKSSSITVSTGLHWITYYITEISADVKSEE